MRTVVFAVVVGVAVGGLHATPAAADEPPTGVAISWADSAGGKLKLTWSDSGAGNIVRAFVQGDIYPPKDIGFVPAGAANELVFDHWARLAPNAVVRVGVYNALDSSTTTSLPAYTTWFDTNGAGTVSIVAATPRPDGRVQLRWRLTPRPEVLPDDVLDLSPAQVHTTAITTKWCCRQAHTPVPAGARTFVLPFLARPFAAEISPRNEWGSNLVNPVVHIGEYAVHAPVPTVSTYARPMPIAGRVTLLQHPEECEWEQCIDHRPAVGAGVVLQTRPIGAQRWQNLAATRTNGTGQFRFHVTPPGSREYRVVAPAPKSSTRNVVFLGTSKPARNMTRYLIRQAAFTDPTATYGQRVTARLTVAPPVGVRTLLQRWTGSRWINFVYVSIHNGTGSFTFTTARRGTTGYRFLLPPTSYAGRPITATTTPSFTLVTR